MCRILHNNWKCKYNKANTEKKINWSQKPFYLPYQLQAEERILPQIPRHTTKMLGTCTNNWIFWMPTSKLRETRGKEYSKNLRRQTVMTTSCSYYDWASRLSPRGDSIVVIRRSTLCVCQVSAGATATCWSTYSIIFLRSGQDFFTAPWSKPLQEKESPYFYHSNEIDDAEVFVIAQRGMTVNVWIRWKQLHVACQCLKLDKQGR